MARQTDGISQFLVSASALTLSGSSKLTLSYWLWWDSFATDGAEAVSYGTVSGDGLIVVPNDSSGTYNAAYVSDTGFSPHVDAYLTWPSSAAWHHHIVAIDRSLANTAQIPNVWLDGNAAPAGLAKFFSGNVSSTWPNSLLYLMAFVGTSSFGAGRIAEMALYSGYNFLQADADALYNTGRGALATNVQGGSLSYYWRLLGLTSPEPATVGGVDLTVTGATYAIHPFDLEDEELEAGRRFVSVP